MTPVPSSPVALLDQLDELRAKATPGPWARHPNADDTVVGAYAEGGEDGPEFLNVADCRGEWPCARADQEAADAALIVAAVNALDGLVTVVREMWDEHDGRTCCDRSVESFTGTGLCDTRQMIETALSVTP